MTERVTRLASGRQSTAALAGWLGCRMHVSRCRLCVAIMSRLPPIPQLSIVCAAPGLCWAAADDGRRFGRPLSSPAQWWETARSEPEGPGTALSTPKPRSLSGVACTEPSSAVRTTRRAGAIVKDRRWDAA